MRSTPADPAAADGAPHVSTVVAAAGLAAWWWATVGANHPTHGFEVLRQRCGSFGLVLPDWRFFAPHPLQHDFRILYRVHTAGGERTEWAYALDFPRRLWWHSIFHPGKRRGKATIDLLTVVLAAAQRAPMEAVQALPAFRLLAAFVEGVVRSSYAGDDLPRGFQFAVVRHTGWDEDHEPDYLLAAPYVALGDRVPD